VKEAPKCGKSLTILFEVIEAPEKKRLPLNVDLKKRKKR
jgi:hypothetical protein